MHHMNHFLGLFELNNPCMHVKLETLRDISTLGNQIYVSNALSQNNLDYMDLGYGGLDDMLIRLGELGRGSPTFSVSEQAC